MSKLLPADNAKKATRLKRIRFLDTYSIAFGGRSKNSKIIFVENGTNEHYTIAVYDKGDKAIFDIHKTERKKDSVKYTPFLQMTIDIMKLKNIAETRGNELQEKTNAVLNNLLKPVTTEELVDLNYPAFPLRPAPLNAMAYNTREVEISNPEDMQNKFGILKNTNTLIQHDFTAAMLMPEDIRRWKVVIRRDGTYYMCNANDLIFRYFKVILKIFDGAISIEDKVNGTTISFAEMIRILEPEYYEKINN